MKTNAFFGSSVYRYRIYIYIIIYNASVRCLFLSKLQEQQMDVLVSPFGNSSLLLRLSATKSRQLQHQLCKVSLQGCTVNTAFIFPSL